MRLEHDVVRFTIIPEQGTQVWSQIPVVRVKPNLSELPTSESAPTLTLPGNHLRRRILRITIQLRWHKHRSQH